MNVSVEELRERYSALETDELLNIKVSSDLSEQAITLLDAELNSRNVNTDDYKEAKEINAYLEKERDEVKNNMKRRIKRLLIIWGIVIIWVILYLLIK